MERETCRVDIKVIFAVGNDGKLLFDQLELSVQVETDERITRGVKNNHS